MLDIEKPRNAIRGEGLSAWFLSNVFHRDEVADLVLGVSPEKTNTRPWLCLLFPDKPPVKIVHVIERSILDHVPGKTITYGTWEDLGAALSRSVPHRAEIAADFSRDIPVGSFLDHGMALLVEAAGCTLVPAEALVARCLGTLDAEGRRSHDAAARVLHAVVGEAWAFARERLAAGAALHEGDMRDLVQERVSAAGLVGGEPPLVACGINSGDPHYTASGRGARIAEGDVVQLDLWAREDSPAAVFADISWVGIAARSPSPGQKTVFDAVVEAREAAVDYLQKKLQKGISVSGSEVDAEARRVLVSRGFSRALRHRTGHSIGHRVHGFGVNLDSVEFPDNRAIPDGACFSIEPGVYLDDFGMRTEIDCCISNGRLDVTGPGRQMALLTLG
ncbi:MAG TPA: M24 family metallopeptidase [Spirochaetia bacterium]|nr:M24 family metallopeptidase [Spirochaetia bacterium]